MPIPSGAGFRSQGHNGRMGPVGRHHGRYEVGRAGAVLADAALGFAGYPGQAVGSMGGRLFVGHGDESDARCGKQIQRIHVGRADDAEYILHAFSHQGFHQRLTGRHFLLCHGFHSLMLVLNVWLMLTNPFSDGVVKSPRSRLAYPEE